MIRTLRLSLALGAILVTAVALSACGSDDSLPGDSVARYGDETIKKSEYDRWLKHFYTASQGGAPGASKTPPTPPDFTACVATARKNEPKPAKGQKAKTTAAFKKDCRTQYEGLRDQAMAFLLQGEWLAAERGDRDIEITDKKIAAEIAKARKQYPGKNGFDTAIKAQGLTQPMLEQQILSGLSETEIVADIRKEQPNATPAQVSAYYKKNKAKFAKRETRDLRVVIASSKQNAEAARSALEGGQSWKTVSTKYSTDPGLKSSGGVVSAFEKPPPGAAQSNGIDKGLTDAIFKAEKGVLVGPVKAQLAHYVIQVQKIVPPTQKTEKQAAAEIRKTLKDEQFEKAFNAFRKSYEKDNKADTECRDGYKMPLCDGQKTPTQPQQPPGGQPAPVQPQAPPGN